MSDFFCQAEDGIRDLVRSRGLGDVYKRQEQVTSPAKYQVARIKYQVSRAKQQDGRDRCLSPPCLLYTSDAADERSSVDLGGRRIIKKKKQTTSPQTHSSVQHTLATVTTKE